MVVGTGSRTAIGKIHDAMASQEEEMSPLKKKLDEFGSFLSKAIAVICVLVWVINIRCTLHHALFSSPCVSCVSDQKFTPKLFS